MIIQLNNECPFEWHKRSSKENVMCSGKELRDSLFWKKNWKILNNSVYVTIEAGFEVPNDTLTLFTEIYKITSFIFFFSEKPKE